MKVSFPRSERFVTLVLKITRSSPCPEIFLRERKKWWLLPMILVLLLFGALIVLTSGSAVAPFVYTLF